MNRIFAGLALSLLTVAGVSSPAQAAPQTVAATAPVQAADTMASCASRSFQYNARLAGTYQPCVRIAQATIQRMGIPVTVDGYFGVGTANAVLNFQNQQGLPHTGLIGPMTWRALASPKTPSQAWNWRCTQPSSTPTACVDLANRRAGIFEPQNGRMVLTLQTPVRTGGFAPDMKGVYSVNDTPRGTYTVWYKNANLVSTIYGNTPMPYSVCFNGSICFHFSDSFAAAGPYYGYFGASHGCVNILDRATAKAIFDKLPNKALIHVY